LQRPVPLAVAGLPRRAPRQDRASRENYKREPYAQEMTTPATHPGTFGYPPCNWEKGEISDDA
jgi:hypothetical protein